MRHTAEGHKEGETVTVATSGWPSGDPFSNVMRGTGGPSVIEARLAAAKKGSFGYRLAGRGTTETCYLEDIAASPAPNGKGGGWFYATGLNASSFRMLQIRESTGGNVIAYVVLSSTALTLRDQAFTTMDTFNATPAAATWYYLTWDATANGTTSVGVSINIYDSTGASLLDTLSATVTTGASVTNVGCVRWGASVATANWPTATDYLYLDDIQSFVADPSPLVEQKWLWRGIYGGPSFDPPLVCQDFADPKTSLGITYVINCVASTTTCSSLRAKGLKGSWWTGSYNAGTRTWSRPDTGSNSITTYVNVALANPDVDSHYYQLTDEPAYSANAAADFNTRIALIKSIDPAAKVGITFGAAKPATDMVNWANNSNLDFIRLDLYGVNGVTGDLGNPGTWQPDLRRAHFQEAHDAQAARATLRFFGAATVTNDAYVSTGLTAPNNDPAYTGTNSRLPSFPGATLAAASTDNQIKEQVDHFRADPIIEGLDWFAYDPYPAGAPSDWTGYLRNRPDLQAEIASQMLATAPVSTIVSKHRRPILITG